MINGKERNNLFMTVAFLIVCAVFACTLCVTSLSSAKYTTSVSGSSSSAVVARPAFLLNTELHTGNRISINENAVNYMKFYVSNLDTDGNLSEVSLRYYVELLIPQGANLNVGDIYVSDSSYTTPTTDSTVYSYDSATTTRTIDEVTYTVYTFSDTSMLFGFAAIEKAYYQIELSANAFTTLEYSALINVWAVQVD